MTGWTVKVDDTQVRRLLENARQAIPRAVSLSADEFVDQLGKESPRKSGDLSRSWSKRRIGPTSFAVDSSVDYARYLYEGTGIYGPKHRPITPRRASVLRFEANGQIVFARSVSGVRPNRYVDRAERNVEAHLPRIIDRALRETGAA